MDTDLFNHKTPLSDYRGDAWRVVESQEDAATLAIVDSIDEQLRLEELLDTAKPPYRKGTEHMDYLLKTAFRYPPLKYGSRFGTQLMPSYFYASEKPATALCETAYYRFLLLAHMATPYEAPIRSNYSLFKVTVSSSNCLDLTTRRYIRVQEKISDPKKYSYSQQIGQWAIERERPSDLIRFYSARKANAINLAVAEPNVIRSKKPRDLRTWLCLTIYNSQQPNHSSVSFMSRNSQEIYEFRREAFTDTNGQLADVV